MNDVTNRQWLRQLLQTPELALLHSIDAALRNSLHLQFFWYTVDVPKKMTDPVLARIDKPKARSMHAIDWFRGKENLGL